jgi:glutamate dehydrogenase (NADP+)
MRCADWHWVNHDGCGAILQFPVKGTNMPCTPEAIDIFLDKKILYAPGKAANASGVEVSGLEMVHNRMRLNWLGEEVDKRLRIIMEGIHRTCLDTAQG